MDDKKTTLEEAMNRLRENGMGEPDAYLLITVKKDGLCAISVCADKQVDGTIERCMLVKCMKDLMNHELALANALTSYAESKGIMKSIKASAANGEEWAENIIRAAEKLLNRDEEP